MGKKFLISEISLRLGIIPGNFKTDYVLKISSIIAIEEYEQNREN